MARSGGAGEVELPTLLAWLERELRARVPDAAASLRPGRPAADVARAARVRGVVLCAPVLTLYGWHDGTEPVRGAYRGQLFPDGGMLPSEAALELYEAVSADLAGEGWDPSWFPLFQGDRDEVHAVVLEPDGGCGEVVSFDVLSLPAHVIEHPSLEAWAAATVARFQAGVYRAAGFGAVEADARLLAALLRSQAPAPCDVEALVDAVASPDEGARAAALADLRRHLHPEAVGPLVAMLEGRRPGSRADAAELLGMIGDLSARAPLAAAAEGDPHPLVRAMARRALQELPPAHG